MPAPNVLQRELLDECLKLFAFDGKFCIALSSRASGILLVQIPAALIGSSAVVQGSCKHS